MDDGRALPDLNDFSATSEQDRAHVGELARRVQEVTGEAGKSAADAAADDERLPEMLAGLHCLAFVILTAKNVAQLLT